MVRAREYVSKVRQTFGIFSSISRQKAAAAAAAARFLKPTSIYKRLVKSRRRPCSHSVRETITIGLTLTRRRCRDDQGCQVEVVGRGAAHRQISKNNVSLLNVRCQRWSRFPGGGVFGHLTFVRVGNSGRKKVISVFASLPLSLCPRHQLLLLSFFLWMTFVR